MCHGLRGSKVEPSEEQTRGVQRLKHLGNFDCLFDYTSIGFSMASLCALNSPIAKTNSSITSSFLIGVHIFFYNVLFILYFINSLECNGL